jgi:hypothetical protein
LQLLLLLSLRQSLLSYLALPCELLSGQNLSFKLLRFAQTCLSNSAGKIFLRIALQQKPGAGLSVPIAH